MNILKKSLCVFLAAVIVCSVSGMFASAAETLPKDASYIAGDATGDGIINSSDALAIINHVTKVVPIEDVVRRTAGDVTGDNKLTSSDALMILNFKVGNIESKDFVRKNFNVQKVANNIFLFAPENVDVTYTNGAKREEPVAAKSPWN